MGVVLVGNRSKLGFRPRLERIGEHEHAKVSVAEVLGHVVRVCRELVGHDRNDGSLVPLNGNCVRYCEGRARTARSESDDGEIDCLRQLFDVLAVFEAGLPDLAVRLDVENRRALAFEALAPHARDQLPRAPRAISPDAGALPADLTLERVRRRAGRGGRWRGRTADAERAHAADDTDTVSGVQFGIYVPQVGYSYEQMLQRARKAEEVGFDSLWVYDHLYAPMLEHQPAFEGWTIATALLANTTRLRVGHMVLCNTFRHPALLAKMATTLDVISGGRLDFGIGSGSWAPEHAQIGIEWGTIRERSARLAEALEIITSMFTNERTSFAGQYYEVDGLPNLPPPVQQPRPPVFIGGAGERFTLPLVARYADVWNVPTYAIAELDAKVAALRSECERIGRDPAEITFSIEAVMVLAADAEGLAAARALGERRYGNEAYGLEAGGFVGTPAAVRDRIGEYAEKGFSHFVFFTHDRAADETLELFASEVMPAFG